VEPKCVLAESADGSQARYGRIGWIKKYGAQQRLGVLTVPLVVVVEPSARFTVPPGTSMNMGDHHHHVSGGGRRAKQHSCVSAIGVDGDQLHSRPANYARFVCAN
jgi:hypothetical protein